MNPLPCPFCGGVDIKFRESREQYGHGEPVENHTRLYCANCGCSSGTVSDIGPRYEQVPELQTSAGRKQAVLAKWNRRVA